MNLSRLTKCVIALAAVNALALTAQAELGKRFPSEKKIVNDPVTGTPLTFLTSTPAGDSKIYPTHPQWTIDGQWLVFRTNRVQGDAMAVNEKTGDLVQVTEGGYNGALVIGVKSMRLFITRPVDYKERAAARDAGQAPAQKGPGAPTVPSEVVAIDLAKLFADSAAGKLQPAAAYEKVFGTIPLDIGVPGELAIDGSEKYVYFKMSKDLAAKSLPPGTKIAEKYGPRGMGAGPSGVAKMNLETGECTPVVAVPFQVGHIQANPWHADDVVFCWETGGKAPQRTWYVKNDGTGLRPLFPETEFDWVTHEGVTGPDEAVMAILGHNAIGKPNDWGKAGTREHQTGLAIVNLRTGAMIIAGQTKAGSGFWHVHASADGRWATGDDFTRSLYLIDRHTNEMILLTTGHKETAADHVHPTFSPDGTRIEIQSAMLSADNRTMNICVVPVPDEWLKRTYDEKKYPTADNPMYKTGRP